MHKERGLYIQIDRLYTQKERDSMLKEKDIVHKERGCIHKERDSLHKQNDYVHKKRGTVCSKRRLVYTKRGDYVYTANNNLLVNNSLNAYSDRTFLNKTTSVWNSLPADMKLTDSIVKFKTLARNFYFNNNE